ncbi:MULTISPECIES: DUF4307 domain-containing protein [Streptomyces]|uniref:DUF4307 domain-containing protein n=1 Tax=Streptomyces nigrescens TaxID=1920 RepID=A0A640TIQ9_STRNI|nr:MULTISPECIES: DUF4307 domain-containing protein [Streptomyces]MCX5444972.1 DUF4307 domain-containing protein [Streptomyces libani]WAT96978.1 DUF4307 domain-containing protein [Streptomyces libani subsp. libani]WDT57274.1 DUF4307 domain-containing protein [Streptomyces sp. G7(2002)]GFE22401.1 membrane protein [Streptomyces libani subsp. libani]GGV90834.1 membrane protein [Streptomyces libani subsp. libani]
MTAVREGLPDGRYGRSADERADRKLKIIGAVLGAALLGVIGWSGISYISGQDLSGRVIGWDAVSDHALKVHLEVVKDADTTGVCTLRSQAEDGSEVGRKDITVDQRSGQVDTEVTVRTTKRATNAVLVGCTASGAR